MTQINTNNIDAAFPLQGQDNPSQGFRDNFSYIKIALDAAAQDITSLENIALGGTGTLVIAVATATNIVQGTVKIGSGVDVTEDGTISVNTGTPYTLTSATVSTLGGVKIGSGVNISGTGTISVTPYTLTSATGATLGGVKIGSGVNISGDGTISVNTGTITAKTLTVTSSTVLYNNITVAGNTPKFQADFSGSLTDRLKFQSSTVDGDTGVYALPNGNGNIGFFGAMNTSDPQNCGLMITGIDDVRAGIISTQIGTGRTVDIELVIDSTTALTVHTSTNVSVTNNLNVGGTITAGAPFVLPSYATTTLNTIVSTATGSIVFVTNAPGGAQPCFFDGTSWKTVGGTTI